MVRCCVDRRQLVYARWKTFTDSSRQNTVLSCAVQTLEERKLGRISESSLGQRAELFDDNMRVANDLALGV